MNDKIKIDEREGRLIGRRFLINIALPEKTTDGLTVLNRDPRKAYKKPAVYSGTVESASEDCLLVAPGDLVIVERWEYQQSDVDDQRMTALEKHLIAINGMLMPNFLVIEVEDDSKPRSSLYLPDPKFSTRRAYYHGKLLASTAPDRFGLVGEDVYVESYDSGQYLDGNKLYFKTNSVAHVLLRIQRKKARKTVTKLKII